MTSISIARGEHAARRPPTAVHMSDVRVSFNTHDGAVTALDGLSLQIPTGGVFCLLGPNGAGKTTTINVITGLVPADVGTAAVFGLSPSGDRSAVLERLALVPQETALYESLTGRENLTFHARYYGIDPRSVDRRVDDALELVRLAGRQHDRVGTYSGGMRRRLALARALLGDARLLLLDEPTLGVDVQSRNAIWEQIRRLADDGIAVLLTTNYMDEAEALADTVLLIDRGREVATGTPSELKSRVGRQSLRLHFETRRDAARAHAALASARSATVDGDRVTVELTSPAEAITVLRELPDALGRMAGFEMHEPSLQDVFLHFTGRALRD